MSVTLRISQDASQVRHLMAQGWCPVECSIDGLSLVDELEMDHHGSRGHLEPVAVRALRDAPGAREADPRFVGVGEADADMTFAVAVLAGILPVGDVRVAALAELVARMDTDPMGVDLQSHPLGGLLLLWVSLASGGRDTQSATAAVWLWHHLLRKPVGTWTQMASQALAADVARKTQAQQAMAQFGTHYGQVLVIEDAPRWGFDVWYGRLPEHGPTLVHGWRHPVVLWRQASTGQVMVGCPNEEVARALFGPEGLGVVFTHLCPAGWGGRVAVGGSPRGQTMSLAQLHRAGQALDAWLSK